jgi:hypothetical protein
MDIEALRGVGVAPPQVQATDVNGGVGGGGLPRGGGGGVKLFIIYHFSSHVALFNANVG